MLVVMRPEAEKNCPPLHYTYGCQHYVGLHEGRMLLEKIGHIFSWLLSSRFHVWMPEIIRKFIEEQCYFFNLFC